MTAADWIGGESWVARERWADLYEDLTAERDALAARLAAVEALADETERAGDPLLRLDRLRAALTEVTTDTTKESSDE